MLNSLIDLIFLFLFSSAMLFILRKASRQIGLVDKPNERKLHEGAVPLVGGLTICLSLLYFLFHHPNIIPNSPLYAICIVILVSVGALDDKYNISYKYRFFVQSILSIAMMYLGDMELHTIGNILPFNQTSGELGWAGYIVTLLAVIGAINAFNMVDGIDGLLGGLSIITFGSLGMLLAYDKQYNIAFFCLVIIVTILPYLFYNLGFFGRKRKVFMGDAGSMLIGFTVIWLLLLSSQNGSNPPLRPVTALWLIAVPLIDMAAIMIRRIRKGVSPFEPDREHLHHIVQRLGFNSTKTLMIICIIATVYAGIGIYAEIMNVPEYIMFCLFIFLAIFYILLLSNIWKITARLKRVSSPN